jgi:hypothetical protein
VPAALDDRRAQRRARAPVRYWKRRGLPGGILRKCVCCGEPTPTQSMCACWGHWTALPEDLRSEILTSYGRGAVADYHRSLLKAVAIWRRRGVWRVSFDA